MDKKIVRIVGHSKELIFPFSGSGPWKLYAQKFIDSGFAIAGIEQHPRITHLVAHSHSKKAISEAIRSGVPLKNRTLIIWEPKVVNEKIRSKKIKKLYGTLIYASQLWDEENEARYFQWPQSVENFNEIDFKEWTMRENSAVMIQANKYSIHKDEMYSLRRRVIREFEGSSGDLSLYGSHWDAGFFYNFRSWIASSRRIRAFNWRIKTIGDPITKFSNYLGEIDNKHVINSKYRVSIVIENSLDYVSEKLFDALAAGTYVIYCGPPLHLFNLENLKIHLSSPNAAEIKKIISEFLDLPASEQYKSMLLQRKSILVDLHRHDHNLVLPKLAEFTILNFEHD